MNEFAELPLIDRLAQRWGHSAHLVLSAAIVAVILIGLFPTAGALSLTVPVLVLGVVITSWLLMRQHDRRLCEQCAAAIPLNPAERAARYRRMFRLTHCGSEPRYLIPYLAVLIGSNFATTTVGRIGWAIVQSSMIYLIMAHTAHRRLQPWCPWCSGGDGGGEHEDVAPPPPPVDHRQPV
jgi:hypothetical protein